MSRLNTEEATAPAPPMDWHSAIVAKPNEFMLPENNGQDAFTAKCDEFPGILAIAATQDDAISQYKTLLRRILESAPAEDRKRLETTQALVQFNHRITANEKLRIAERAKAANLSIRQFVLNQCLYAQVWTSGSGMGKTAKRDLLDKMNASAAPE